jgi:hypothetical protein
MKQPDSFDISTYNYRFIDEMCEREMSKFTIALSIIYNIAGANIS